MTDRQSVDERFRPTRDNIVSTSKLCLRSDNSINILQIRELEIFLKGQRHGDRYVFYCTLYAACTGCISLNAIQTQVTHIRRMLTTILKKKTGKMNVSGSGIFVGFSADHSPVILPCDAYDSEGNIIDGMAIIDDVSCLVLENYPITPCCCDQLLKEYLVTPLLPENHLVVRVFFEPGRYVCQPIYVPHSGHIRFLSFSNVVGYSPLSLPIYPRLTVCRPTTSQV